MDQNRFFSFKVSRRSLGAIFFFSCGLLAFQLGVSVSERPDVVNAGFLSHAYYSLSLFVIGGVELGSPTGGSSFSRALLWVAYFGAPILAATTLLDTILHALTPQSWQLKRMKNHIIVVSSGDLSYSYLRVLRSLDKKTPVVVACRNVDENCAQEFEALFDAHVVRGDVTHEYFLRQLRVHRAKKILLFGDNSLRNYEAASHVLKMIPGCGDKIVIHCARLRFMRAMATSKVAQQCHTFNTYHLAAVGLVRNHLLAHFRETTPKDVVILAGFGRFGQTILEELQIHAKNELDTVAIVDIDAQRRVMVAEEQMRFSDRYTRKLFEGDIAHPEVWRELYEDIHLGERETVVVLGTGREEDNLRTALWISNRFPGTRIFARSSGESQFATELCQEHGIVNISITQLVEDNIPQHWIS